MCARVLILSFTPPLPGLLPAGDNTVHAPWDSRVMMVQERLLDALLTDSAAAAPGTDTKNRNGDSVCSSRGTRDADDGARGGRAPMEGGEAAAAAADAVAMDVERVREDDSASTRGASEDQEKTEASPALGSTAVSTVSKTNACGAVQVVAAMVDGVLQVGATIHRSEDHSIPRRHMWATVDLLCVNHYTSFLTSYSNLAMIVICGSTLCHNRHTLVTFSMTMSMDLNSGKPKNHIDNSPLFRQNLMSALTTPRHHCHIKDTQGNDHWAGATTVPSAPKEGNDYNPARALDMAILARVLLSIEKALSCAPSLGIGPKDDPDIDYLSKASQCNFVFCTCF